ncbi:MAG: PhoX family protein, partial [Pseudobdellovibrionaceae bacterium]
MESHPEFPMRFRHITDLMVRTREAAKILGGTPLDRPEDIEINPANGDVIVSLTNNNPQNRPHGSLLRIQEKDSNPSSLEFKSSTWISGGPEVGLSCPDNLVFDKSGNLWCTNDISDEKMNQGIYETFKNNGLYFIPMHGPSAGRVFQVASAPRDAEITGPMFTPDGETLLISVQHPGDQSKSLNNLTSRWPDGPGQIPKSSLVSITGDRLKALVNYRG